MNEAARDSNPLNRLRAIAAGMQHRTDHELCHRLEVLVARERGLTCEIVLHLVEAGRCRLHCKAGYSSLFDYYTRGLGYSESAAGRRIRAA